MSRTVVRAIVLAALAALLLTAAACGGDDDESAAASPPAAAETTGSDDATATEEDADSDDGDADFDNAANCKEFAEVGAKVSEALSGTGADIGKTKDLLNDLADAAPDEIQDDFQVIADAYGKIADAIGDADLSAGATPDAETLAKLTALASEIDQAKLTEANTNITAWVTENCGGTG